MRDQSGEGIVGDLGPRAADGADQRALADVGEAEQAYVRHHAQLEPQLAHLTGFAALELARRAIGRRRKMLVATPALAAGSDDEALAVAHELAQLFARLGIE